MMAMSESATGGPPELSPREARDRWLDKQRVSKREQTISTLYYRLKLFTEWCEREDILRMRDLTGWDLESYEADRRSKAKALTLNKEFGTLRNFLEATADWGLIDHDIAETVTPPDVPRDELSDDTMLEAGEALRLLSAYRADGERGYRGHVLLELAWHTGARIGGLRALDVRDFDADREFVRFVNRPETGTPLKNGPEGERAVALTSTVAEIVAAYVDEYRHDVSDDKGRQPLLPSTQGRPTPGTVRDWMYQTTQPCHYGPCPHEKTPETCSWTGYNQASKCPSSRSPHQVRTGAITWMRDRGVPAEVVAERVNSSVDTIEQHYDKADDVGEMEARRRKYVSNLEFENDEN